MSIVHPFHPDTAGQAAIFATIVIFTVLSLEGLRVYAERGADAGRVRTLSVALGLVFLALAAGGGASLYDSGRAGLANLGAFLSGTAGIGILIGLAIGIGRQRELRRIASQDL